MLKCSSNIIHLLTSTIECWKWENIVKMAMPETSLPVTLGLVWSIWPSHSRKTFNLCIGKPSFSELAFCYTYCPISPFMHLLWSWPNISQSWSLEISRLANFVWFRNIVRRILRLQNWEILGRDMVLILKKTLMIKKSLPYFSISCWTCFPWAVYLGTISCDGQICSGFSAKSVCWRNCHRQNDRTT